MAQLRHRLGLYLADTLTGHAVHAADIVQRLGLAVLQTVTHLDDAGLAGAQSLQHLLELLLQQRERDRVGRRDRVGVLDEVAELGIAVLAQRRVQRQMLQDLGREPTPDELARELDMPVEKVQEVQKYGREPISLHTPLGEDGDSEFGDLIEDTDAIAPSDAVAFSLLQEQFKQVLETLSPREAGVIKMRYGLEDGQPKTLDDIGRVYGVTRERIRQIESKTMSKLRHPSRSQTLRDFLDQ